MIYYLAEFGRKDIGIDFMKKTAGYSKERTVYIWKRLVCMILACSILMSGIYADSAVAATAKKTSQDNKTQSDKSDKEDKYPYLIQVNKGTNVVTIYSKDEKGKYNVPEKAFVCSTGVDTPVGTFKTPNKFRWQPLQNDVWGQYCTQISGNYLFHSVYYDTKNPADLNIRAYNLLGTTASHGCIRLTCGDAKWIYDNCALGTTVKIINGSSKNDPLGKPKAMKISTGWDPTDPDPKNPWHNQLFSITYNGPKTVEYNSKLKDLSSYVMLQDVCGTTASKKKYLKVTGKVNTKKLGSYKLTYSAKDKMGKTTTKQVTIKVVDTKKPILNGVENITIERNAKFDKLKGVSAVSVSGKKIKKSKIKVTGATVNTSIIGTYTLTYTVVGTNKKKRTKTRKVKVVDTKKPVIQNVKNRVLIGTEDTLSEEEKVAQIKSDVMKQIQIKDNGVKVSKPESWTTLVVTKIADNVYTVLITVKDSAGNTSELTVQYSLQFNNTAASTQTAQ